VDVNAISADFAKEMARSRLEKAGLPDPVCRTGIISLPIASLGKKQACCPAYCKECDDYKTCESVRGQASKNACCASNVLKMECGQGAAANVCLKKCTEALPPCIMEDGKVWDLEPPKVNAADDCNKAIPEWTQHKKAAIEAGEESAETAEAKITLKKMKDTTALHSKVVDDAADTGEKAKTAASDADDAISKAKEYESKMDAEMEKETDEKKKAEIKEMKEKLIEGREEAEESKKDLTDAASDLDSSKKDLDDKLNTLKSHAEAAEKDAKSVLDKKADIKHADEAAKKTTEHHHKVKHHIGIVRKIVHAVVDVAKDIAHHFHW
jgi:hypothetical protein